jgi:hypothetical protein
MAKKTMKIHTFFSRPTVIPSGNVQKSRPAGYPRPKRFALRNGIFWSNLRGLTAHQG